MAMGAGSASMVVLLMRTGRSIRGTGLRTGLRIGVQIRRRVHAYEMQERDQKHRFDDPVNHQLNQLVAMRIR